MKKSKFTEQQIAFALKQAESGISVEEVCRKIGISEATFYNLEEEVRRTWRIGASLHSVTFAMTP